MAYDTADRDESGHLFEPSSGAPMYVRLSPAEEAAILLDQTRAFSRAVDQFRAAMEQYGMMP
jgi:hypothetical protein